MVTYKKSNFLLKLNIRKLIFSSQNPLICIFGPRARKKIILNNFGPGIDLETNAHNELEGETRALQYLQILFHRTPTL
jgi:hypothetical protein